MTFAQSISTCFSKYATFSGRATRSEFWWFALFLTLVDFATSLVSEALSSVWSLVTVLPYAAVAWRRLHDIDRTGLWTLAPLLPMVVAFVSFVGTPNLDEIGAIFWVAIAVTCALVILNIVFWATPGTRGPNRYGEVVSA